MFRSSVFLVRAGSGSCRVFRRKSDEVQSKCVMKRLCQLRIPIAGCSFQWLRGPTINVSLPLKSFDLSVSMSFARTVFGEMCLCLLLMIISVPVVNLAIGKALSLSLFHPLSPSRSRLLRLFSSFAHATRKAWVPSVESFSTSTTCTCRTSCGDPLDRNVGDQM